MQQKVSISSGYNPKPVTAAIVARRVKGAKKRYIRWLNRNHPRVLNDALRQAGLSRSDVGLSGLGQTEAGTGNVADTGDEKAWYDRVLDYLPSAASAYAGYKQQEQLIEINRERAKQGLEPLQTPPTIRIEGEAGPATRASMQAGMKDAIGQYVPYLLLGIGAWIMMRPKPRRR